MLDGKLYMVVLVNFLSDRCYSKKALLNADAALLLIPKHPVSAIKLIIGTLKQDHRGLGFARLDLLYQKEWVHFVVLNNFFRKKLKKCDRHKNSLANTLIKKLNIRRANRRMDFVDMFDMMEVVDVVLM